MVIVAGSATSWIQDKLINNHGGLYGRVTYEIELEPFTLRECELLFMERGVRLSRYDIVQSHMIFGGIQYYLNYFQRGKSLAQIVDEMFFQKGAKLSICHLTFLFGSRKNVKICDPFSVPATALSVPERIPPGKIRR